ncbi:MAG TPA: Holliday junction ATP-dependent DNA helicase RuvA [Oligoflexia bacterium]|nr:Holliday junction ATP-dependent DNA helicase RuvA [Oligoflexia bacterium]
MIGRLQGKVVEAAGSLLIIDVHGVGYEVVATSAVLAGLNNGGNELSMLVYTDVKENAIVLYGFHDQLEKQTFLLLKKVKGIGSRMASGIVSAIGACELLANIGRSDVRALQRVPGVGKKTAQRLIVELRETVGKLAEEAQMPVFDDDAGAHQNKRNSASNPELDARLALEKLGFSSDAAQNAVSAAMAELAQPGGDSAGDPGELLRAALSKL